MSKIKLGIIGTGARGGFLLSELLLMDDITVAAVCDLYEDRLESARASAAEKNPEVLATNDYHVLLRSGIDGVIIATSWDSHITIACEAMECGVRPAIECGGAASVDESWKLVRTSQRTGVDCMFLENCNFGRDEMTVLNMIKQGLFGEIVYCAGGYQHDCRALVAQRKENRQARFENYFGACGEIYPSHEFGPIMKYLDINHGNRIVSLTSSASKAVGLMAYNGERTVQGDVVTTQLCCAGGELVSLIYETTLPRPYSRAGRVDGTKGCYLADANGICLDGITPPDVFSPFSPMMDDERYEHPLWKEYRSTGLKVNGGHGGMDYLVLREFIDSIAQNRAPYLDVYDAALLTAITPLSKESLECGRTVAVPDFTDGKWILEKRLTYR